MARRRNLHRQQALGQRCYLGAIVGITCGRAVTVRVRVTRMALVPQAVPGGGAVLVTAMRRPV
jgi:hypothetical protein